MKKQIEFTNKEQVKVCRKKIIENIDKANLSIKKINESTKGFEFIRQIKFEKSSLDTLFDEPINFIEQINQTCTYLVCLAAVEILLSEHPQHRFIVNFGVAPGYDILSEDKTIICECFAVTAPDSNGKLKRDVEKVNNAMCKHKYVIFYASNPKPTTVENIRSKYLDVKIIALNNI